MEEENEARILNDYHAKTTPTGSVIDIAITMGDWSPAFSYPGEWDLSSTQFPLCIGLSTGEEKNKSKYENIPRYKRSKETSERLIEKCKVIMSEIKNYNSDSLAQSIITAVKEAALQKGIKGKKRQKRLVERGNRYYFQAKTEIPGKQQREERLKLMTNFKVKYRRPKTKASKISPLN